MRVPSRISSLLLVPLFLAATPFSGWTEGARPLVPLAPVFRDCNGNGIDDAVDIAAGDSFDANDNGVPDECEAADLPRAHGPFMGPS